MANGYEDETLGAYGMAPTVPADTWFPVNTATGAWQLPGQPTLASSAGMPDVTAPAQVGGTPDQAPLSIGQVAGGFAPPLGAQPRLQRAARLSEQGLLAPQPTVWESIARGIGMASPQGRAILQGFDQQQQQGVQNRLALRRQQLLEEQETRQATQTSLETLRKISEMPNKTMRNLMFERYVADMGSSGQPLPTDMVEAFKKSSLDEGKQMATMLTPMFEAAGIDPTTAGQLLQEGGDPKRLLEMIDMGLKAKKQKADEMEEARIAQQRAQYGAGTLGDVSGVTQPTGGPAVDQRPRGYVESGTTQPIIGSEKLTPTFTAKATEVANRLQMNPQDLLRIISFETGGTFNPAERNRAGSGATGLIQFTEKTAKALGTTTAALAKMSPEEQLDYVEKYLTPYKGKLGNLKDAYLAVLKPAALGQGLDAPLFTREQDPLAYRQNAGLDTGGKGQVTVGDALGAVMRTTTGGGTAGTAPDTRMQVAGPGAPAGADQAQLQALNNRIKLADTLIEQNMGSGRERTKGWVNELQQERTRLIQERQQLTEASRAGARTREEALARTTVEEEVKGRQTAAEVLGDRVTTFFNKDTGEQEDPGQPMASMRQRLGDKKVAVLSTDQSKQLSVLKQLEPVLDGYRRLAEYAYGKDGPLRDYTRHPLETVGAMWDQLAQSDAKFQAMRRSLEGQLQSVVRALGARGDLNEQELAAAKGMIANFDASLGLGLSLGPMLGTGGVGVGGSIKPSISMPDTPQTGMRVANELFGLVNKRIGSLLGNPGYNKNALLEVPEGPTGGERPATGSQPPQAPQRPPTRFGMLTREGLEGRVKAELGPEMQRQRAAQTSPVTGTPPATAATVPPPALTSGQRALRAMTPAQLRQIPDRLARVVLATPGLERGLSPEQMDALAEGMERWERAQTRR